MYLDNFEFSKQVGDLRFDAFETVGVLGQILDHHSHLVVEHQVRTEVAAFFVEKVVQTSRYALEIHHYPMDVPFVVFHILIQSL